MRGLVLCIQKNLRYCNSRLIKTLFNFLIQYHKEWPLKIKYVQLRDQGIYECQVSCHHIHKFNFRFIEFSIEALKFSIRLNSIVFLHNQSKVVKHLQTRRLWRAEFTEIEFNRISYFLNFIFISFRWQSIHRCLYLCNWTLSVSFAF